MARYRKKGLQSRKSYKNGKYYCHHFIKLIEQYIFQFKEVISRIIYIKKVHISKWYMYIKEALKILNENVTILTENNIHDFLLKNYNQYFGIPQKKFMYQIGEKVVLKARATPDGMKKSLIPGFKRSLGKVSIKRKNFINVHYFSGV